MGHPGTPGRARRQGDDADGRVDGGRRGRTVLIDRTSSGSCAPARTRGPRAARVPSEAGGYRSHSSVWTHGHAKAVKASRVHPKLRIHDLRHTAATLWLAAGESIYFVQQQLGHADIRTTINTYGRRDQQAHAAAAARAAEWWRDPSGTTTGTTRPVRPQPDRSERRRPESNRCTRLCRPLRSHSATSPGASEAIASLVGDVVPARRRARARLLAWQAITAAAGSTTRSIASTAARQDLDPAIRDLRRARGRSGRPPRRSAAPGRWLPDVARLAAPRAISSAGRAPPRQGGGHWFEPSIAHLESPG